MVQFFLNLRLYLGTETVPCRSNDGYGLTPIFSSFNAKN